MIYEVESPNPYSDESQKKRIFYFKILDVLFNEQVCNLVYMQDLTEVYKEKERNEARDNILRANFYTSQELQTPQ